MSIDGRRIDKKKNVELMIVDALRKREYSLNTINNYGENLLHIGAVNGCMEILNEILSRNKDCNIDRKNKFGWTPLMQAIRNGNIEAVKLLLESGSSINESTYLGMSMLGLAAAINEEMFDTVYKVYPATLEQAANDDITPLCIAAMKNDKKLFFKLIDLGLEISKANEYTHLMMRQSTVPEIVSLAKPRLDIEDYWNDCSDNIEVQEGLSQSKIMDSPCLSNTVNEDNIERGLQMINDSGEACGDTNSKECLPETFGPQPRIHISQVNDFRRKQLKTLKEYQKPPKLNLLSVEHFQYDQKSLISPNLTYNRDGGLLSSPSLCFSQNECCLNTEETNNELSNRNEQIYTDLSMVGTLKGCLPPISSFYRLRNIRPSNLEIVDPDVTLNFEPEFSLTRSPHVPVDINNEDSVFDDTTPTPPHCRTPPRGMILNSQQAKLVILLKRFGLGRHVSTFLEQEVDIELFFTLNEMDLKEIGIKRKSNRKALLKVINKCKNAETLSSANIFC